MDLTLLITLTLAVCANAVPPDGPKFVPVFVSSDSLNRINEKENAGKGNTGNQPNDDSRYDVLVRQRSTQNDDYGTRKDQAGYDGPAPVYESHDHSNDMNQAQSQYQQGQIQPQYQPPQQSYQLTQQPNQLQQQSYQLTQQPNQLQQQAIPQPYYQINQQPAPIQQPYQINPQPAQIQQPILLAQIPQANPQPIYANQQIGQPVSNQQPILLNQQQLIPNQPIQYQQPNQQSFIITQPNGQQILLSQPPLQNQQAILLNNQQPPLVAAPNVINPALANQQNQNGHVFAVVPVNNQNVPNQNTNTYLVPVQQLPNQVYAVNAG